MSGARSSFSVPVSSPTPNGLQPAIMSTGKSMKQMEMTRYFNPLGDHLQSATLAKVPIYISTYLGSCTIDPLE